MAEPIEDIIIIDDSEAAGYDTHSEQENKSTQSDNPQKRFMIFAGIGIALIMIVGLAFFLLSDSPQKIDQYSIDFIEEQLDKNTTKTITPSKLENMIAKANYLYTNGSKDEALFLYEKIAIYSEAISHYNLGVAQLKDAQYALALSTFQKAITNDEKRCVSAINAAVCSLHLNDKESFKYYIDLAHAYLSHEIDTPLYSYYYALISYYNNNYIEALSALNNSTSKEYPNVQKHLSAKINALFGNYYDAIDVMEKNYEQSDAFSIALLYANIGDLTLAKKYLEDAISKNIEPLKANLALALVNLKAGKVSAAATQIKKVTNEFPQEVYKPYPIIVKLKDSLFDPQKAQRRYRDKINNSLTMTYQKIFYFSPYKIFNANQTISYIRKGNANIYIDNVQSAKKYLQKSASSSSVNKGITKAIKLALSFKTREANLELQRLITIQPKHSILQYNLALTYAQLGDITNAYKHFLRSYHLDAKNYLSGIYAIMASQIISKDTIKLKSIIKDSLHLEEESEDVNLYKTLLHLSEDNFLATADWLNFDYKQRPLYIALDTIISQKLNKMDIAKSSSKKLTILLPNDILPHLMYMDTIYNKLKPQEYAKEVASYLNKQDFNFNDLYFGPYITRYLYIQQNLIIGKLYFLRQQLRKVIETTNENTHELTSSLALASLYDKAYEESYTLYNQLVDELKVRDAHTLFLAAVASTAASHHENAIALLELSKMKDADFLESRYALGLLYLEVMNNKGGAIQLGRIKGSGFNSEFFDFEIDFDKLTFQKQNPDEG